MPRPSQRNAPILAVAVCIALAPRAAAAQAPAPSYGPPGAAPVGPYGYYPIAAPPPEPPPDPRVADAHADRVVVLPTAYTHPSGSVYATSYDIAGLQIGAGLSDRTQLTLTGTPPLGEDKIAPLDLTLKTAIVADGPVRVAAFGAATGAVGPHLGYLFVGRAGGVVQMCLNEPCDASASMGTTLLLVGPALVMASGAGAIVRLKSWLALLLEVDTLVPLQRDAGTYNGFMVGGGVGFRKRSWGIDLTVLRAGNDEKASFLPLVAATYRFLP